MSTFNGIGTRYYGQRTLPDGTYITTKWFVIFFVPLFPLGSIRILDAGYPYSAVGYSTQSIKYQKVPLDLKMVFGLYAWFVVGIGVLVIWKAVFDWIDR
jgi:hypothetical protein